MQGSKCERASKGMKVQKVALAAGAVFTTLAVIVIICLVVFLPKSQGKKNGVEAVGTTTQGSNLPKEKDEVKGTENSSGQGKDNVIVTPQGSGSQATEQAQASTTSNEDQSKKEDKATTTTTGSQTQEQVKTTAEKTVRRIVPFVTDPPPFCFEVNSVHAECCVKYENSECATYAALEPVQRFQEVGPFSLPAGISEEAMRDKFEGAMLGLGIGDAMGAPYEGLPPSEMKKYKVPLDGYAVSTRRAHVQTPGDFTDDTAHAMVWAAAMIKDRIVNGFSYLRGITSWKLHGYMSAHYSYFGIGNTTIKLLKSSKLDLDKPSSTNGCVMRLAPIPLFYSLRDLKACVDAAGASSAASHTHTTTRDSARLYAAIMWHILHGYTKAQLFSTNLFATMPDYVSSHPDLELMSDLNKVKLNLNDRGYSFEARGAMNYAVHALKETNSFAEGMEMIVRMGHDNDTTAAIYGALAGALYGLKNIPVSLQEQLYAGPVIKQVGSVLLDLAMNPVATGLEQKYPKIVTNGDELVDVNPMRLEQELWYMKPPSAEVQQAKKNQSEGKDTGLANQTI